MALDHSKVSCKIAVLKKNAKYTGNIRNGFLNKEAGGRPANLHKKYSTMVLLPKFMIRGRAASEYQMLSFSFSLHKK